MSKTAKIQEGYRYRKNYCPYSAGVVMLPRHTTWRVFTPPSKPKCVENLVEFLVGPTIGLRRVVVHKTRVARSWLRRSYSGRRSDALLPTNGRLLEGSLRAPFTRLEEVGETIDEASGLDT
jgi:hypothetical protein